MKNPLSYSKEEMHELRGKMLQIKMREPVKIKNSEIEDDTLIGYFHRMLLASNGPNLPWHLYFVHTSISDDPSRELADENTTELIVMNMEWIKEYDGN